MPAVRTVAIIGTGRAAGSLTGALRGNGWRVRGPWGRSDPAEVRGAAHGVDLVLVAVPDTAVAAVAEQIEPVAATVVAHVAGSLRLDVLATHPRRGSLHPLVSMPDAAVGASRLTAGAWFALAASDRAAHTLLHGLVVDLGGRPIEVADEDRARYHAAACIASNHLVALLGQVERIAASAGVSPEAFADLAARSLANATELGAARALTGPVARGDAQTVEAHLAALPAEEVATYLALAREAQRLAHPGEPLPAWASHDPGAR